MANETDILIGKQLRQARLLKGMSQETLGHALGISFQQVQKYENGSNRIGASRLWAISRVLGLPVSFFFEDLPGARYAGEDSTLVSESGMSRRSIQLARALDSIEDKDVKNHFLRLIKACARSNQMSPIP